MPKDRTVKEMVRLLNSDTTSLDPCDDAMAWQQKTGLVNMSQVWDELSLLDKHPCAGMWLGWLVARITYPLSNRHMIVSVVKRVYGVGGDNPFRDPPPLLLSTLDEVLLYKDSYAAVAAARTISQQRSSEYDHKLREVGIAPEDVAEDPGLQISEIVYPLVRTSLQWSLFGLALMPRVELDNVADAYVSIMSSGLYRRVGDTLICDFDSAAAVHDAVTQYLRSINPFRDGNDNAIKLKPHYRE